jgi:3-methylfumaryl-CoA hydratase
MNFPLVGQLKLRERHDVVYREEVTAAPPLDPITDSMAAHRWQVDANSVMLFRYSALTFNGHRIHYDLPYSTNVEGHGGLLVHGPLQATLMLNLACSIGGKLPKHMAYRGVRPLVCGDPIMVDASPENDEAGHAMLAACVRGADGNITMKATVTP